MNQIPATRRKMVPVWVHLVSLVHLVGLIQPNNRDRPDRPNRPHEQDRLADFFSILLVEQDGIEEGSVHMQAIGVLNESELLEPIHEETHS
jgi:hypothetical protein